MMDKTRPQILFYNFGARLGGAEIVLLNFLEQNSEYADYRVLLNEHGTFYDVLVARDIPVEVIETTADRFYSLKREDAVGKKLFRVIPAAMGLFFRVLKYFRKNQFDLVVSNTFKSHLILGFASKFFGINSAWRFHDIVQREYAFNQFSRLNIGLMKFVIPAVKKVIPVSQAVTTSFKNQGFDISKFSVVHNGIDIVTHTATPLDERGTIRIGWIGQFAAWKGIKEYIQLCQTLLEGRDMMGVDMKFIIAGSALFGHAEFEQEVQDLIKAEHSDQFEFLGHVSDVDTFYDGIDVFFHTSIAPDPFPTTILEAGCRGKLVFASKLGGAGEIITEKVDGYLIDMSDLDSTRKLVSSVLSDFQERKGMGAKLQARIQKDLSIKKYHTQLESELLELV